ncbi:MAG: hypothetical protein JO202_02310 [Ktedonobacteraceae bacterium]|nr:hypothetical protein [Ktedonobacteraceae bacterium]
MHHSHGGFRGSALAVTRQQRAFSCSLMQSLAGHYCLHLLFLPPIFVDGTATVVWQPGKEHLMQAGDVVSFKHRKVLALVKRNLWGYRVLVEIISTGHHRVVWRWAVRTTSRKDLTWRAR